MRQKRGSTSSIDVDVILLGNCPITIVIDYVFNERSAHAL